MASSSRPSHNPTGVNQHGKPIIRSYPELKSMLQEFSNQRMSQGEMLRRLEMAGKPMKSRTLQRALKTLNIRTPRRNGMNETEMGVAIERQLENDPLSRWGYRKVSEKLGLQGKLVPFNFAERYMQARDGAAAQARKPGSKLVHARGLWSAGPGEEWGGDGHLKLLDEMGISIWGIVDKATRRELGLFAVPGSIKAAVPVSLYLLTVKKCGGVPIQMLTDMGSETGLLAATHATIRLHYCPALTFEEIPPHKFVKSVYNITRERKWRPLFYAELENILVAWRAGRQFGFQQDNPLHTDLAIWIWARVVQARLDQYVYETNAHKVRKQKNTYLPSGGSHNDFYDFPEEYGMKNLLISVDEGDIDKLLDKYIPTDLFQFASDHGEAIAQTLYSRIGEPNLDVSTAWNVFHNMLAAIDIQTEAM